MRKSCVVVLSGLLIMVAFATQAAAAEASPVYLLFTNTSSHPFKVSGMTLGGKACPACSDRTIAPGAAAMVKIGDLGTGHLKMTITGGGSGACNYDFASDGNSESGDCGSTPKIAYSADVHSDFMFDTRGTPTFDLFYAYDPAKGQ